MPVFIGVSEPSRGRAHLYCGEDRRGERSEMRAGASLTVAGEESRGGGEGRVSAHSTVTQAVQGQDRQSQDTAPASSPRWRSHCALSTLPPYDLAVNVI